MILIPLNVFGMLNFVKNILIHLFPLLRPKKKKIQSSGFVTLRKKKGNKEEVSQHGRGSFFNQTFLYSYIEVSLNAMPYSEGM